MLTIAIDYDGREEIIDAVRALLRDKARHGAVLDAIIEEITPSAIDNYLYTVGLPDLDLIIRTSGEVRFLPIRLSPTPTKCRVYPFPGGDSVEARCGAFKAAIGLIIPSPEGRDSRLPKSSAS